jgi:hypothetical protein
MIIADKDISEYAENIEGVELSLRIDDTAYFVDALITNLYARPKESFIRELTSNAYDASVSVNPDAPIDIHIYYDFDLGNDLFEVTDYGDSMSEEEMYKIYNTLGESTSRGDAKKIGAYGLGSKSPAAYTDFFFIVTRHAGDGVKTTWLFSKYKNAVPKLSKLSSVPLEPEDKIGTTVRVPLSEVSIEEFKHTVLLTTAYFPNVVYNFATAYFSPEQLNAYSVVEFDNMFLRVQSNELYESIYHKILKIPHIVCNNVWYPVDKYTASVDPIYYNIGLKGNLNNISLIRSREDLQYSENTVAEIQKVYRRSEIEFYNKIYKSNRMVDYHSYEDYASHNSSIINFKIAETVVEIGLRKHYVKGTLRGIDMKNISLSHFFDRNMYFDNKKQDYGSKSHTCYYKHTYQKIANKIVNGVNILRKTKLNLFNYGFTVKDFKVLKQVAIDHYDVKDFNDLPNKLPKQKFQKCAVRCINGYSDKKDLNRTFYYVRLPEKMLMTSNTFKEFCTNIPRDIYFPTDILLYKKRYETIENGIELFFDLEKLAAYSYLVRKLKQPAYSGAFSEIAYIDILYSAKINSYTFFNFSSIPLKLDKENPYYSRIIEIEKSANYMRISIEKLLVYLQQIKEYLKDTKSELVFNVVAKALLLHEFNLSSKEVDKIGFFSKNFTLHLNNLQRWLD